MTGHLDKSISGSLVQDVVDDEDDDDLVSIGCLDGEANGKPPAPPAVV